MPATTKRIIYGECNQCKHIWRWEGGDDDKVYKAIVSSKKPKLCTRCINAQQYGELPIHMMWSGSPRTVRGPSGPYLC
jgi:hypothetical protein